LLKFLLANLFLRLALMNKRTKHLVLPFIPVLNKLIISVFVGGIFFLIFLTNPVSAQTKEASLSATFQLPHPGYITTPFSSFHPGIDLCTGLGMPIKPIAKGTVSDAGYNFWGLGLFVEVDHGNGYKSIYAHMGKIYKTKGDKVGENDLLGVVGLTGHTTGPHTHLELSYNGEKVDPKLLLPTIRNYPKEEDFVKIDSATPSAILIPQSTESAVLFNINESTPSSASTILKPTEEEKKVDLKDYLQKQAENNLKQTITIVKPSPTEKPLPIGGNYSFNPLKLFSLK
jgi:murein DD-endopeptidase MepM/ murein hydrolase activator NlpD